jgi:UDPglucose 6-dehydrogenase
VSALVGIVGLGKLGLPIALTLAWRGHSVLAYDVNPARMGWSALSPQERGPDGSGSLADHEADGLPVTFTDLDEVTRRADCIFIVVETPHGPLYEGVTPLPASRADFAYGPLLKAVGEVCSRARSGTEIGVMSTVLPGTIRSRVLPLANGRPLVYCPQFVGMGTVARDICNPEFALIGRDRADPVIIPELLSSFGAPVFTVSYESAELAKVMYNTFVSAKVTLSNIVQRMAYETGANAHDVFEIIRSATQRLGSPAYIGPGMGDGGPCHPRDNVALSWLAREAGVKSDLFTGVMEARQEYIEWLGGKWLELSARRPLVLLGTAFKPGTDIETGSSAVLLASIMKLRGAAVTAVPQPDDLEMVPPGAAAFFIGCPEPEFTGYAFPPGSVVIDPWHRVTERDDVQVFRVGAGQAWPSALHSAG